MRDDEMMKLSDKTLCMLIDWAKRLKTANSLAIALRLEKELSIRWKGNPAHNQETHPNGRLFHGPGFLKPPA